MSEPTKTKAFKDVLDNFIHIGNCYYNGKHFDNVLNIFSDLTEEEQKIFLRGVHHIWTVVEVGVGNVPQALPKPKPDDDPASTEDYNSKLMIETKFWFIRALGISFIAGLASLIVLVIFFASGTTGRYDAAVNIIKIFGLLFK